MYLIYNSRTLHITGIFREYTCMYMVYAAYERIMFFHQIKKKSVESFAFKHSCLANHCALGPLSGLILLTILSNTLIIVDINKTF